MHPSEQLRVGVFCRTSSLQQEQEKNVGRQFEIIAEVLNRNPQFHLVPKCANAKSTDPHRAFFVDEAYNLEEWNEEKELAELFNRIRMGEINAIVVAESNRIFRARLRAVTAKILDFFDEYNVRLFDKAGEFHPGIAMDIQSILGAEDKKALMHKLHEGKYYRAKEEGRPPSGKTPFGYLYDGWGKKWSTLEDESRAIRWTAALATGNRIDGLPAFLETEIEESPLGLTSPEIARCLNQAGLCVTEFYKRNGLKKFMGKNPLGQFSGTMIDTILKQDSYATGEICYSFKETAAVGRNRDFRGSRKKRKVVVKVPVIIEPELYKKVRERRNGRAVKATRNLKHDYLCRDILECSECSTLLYARMKVKTRFRKKDKKLITYRPVPYYQCARKIYADGSRCKSRNYHNAAIVDPIVWEQVKAVLLKPQMLQALAKETEPSDQSLEKIEAEIPVAASKIAELERQSQRLVNLSVTEKITDEQFAAENIRITRELKHAKRHRDRMLDTQNRLQQAKDASPLVDVTALSQKYSGSLESLGFADRHFLVKALFQRIRVSPTGALTLTPKRIEVSR